MQFSTWNTIKLQAKMVSRMNFTIIFGELIKGDLMQMFRELHSSDLPLFSLNFGVITLLPKTQDASKIQQYKHICLLNVSFKIFTKVATIRINSVAEDLISSTQTAFMRGRNILEGVVILHETIHELHRKNQSEVIFKIDFEKAYEKSAMGFLNAKAANERIFTRVDWMDYILHFWQECSNQLVEYPARCCGICGQKC